MEVTRKAFVAGSALGVAAALGAGAALACADEPAKDAQGAAAEGFSPSSWSLLNPQDEAYTASTKQLEALFTPWQLGGLTIENRMVKSAAGSGFGYSSEAAVENYRAIARGGVKMIWIENLACITKNFEVPGYGPLSETPIQEIVDAIHGEGSYAGYQYDTMDLLIGAHTEVDFENFSQATADDLTEDDIAALHADIVDAVVGLKAMGVDAFEINAAGNNLGQAFLSRMRNHREDEYGPQSLENRARFVTELIAAIKQACGEDFPVQVLINVLEENDSSLGQNSLMTTLEENVEFAKLFEAAGANSLHLRLGPLNMHVCQFASDLYFTGRGIEGTTGYGTQFDFDRHWQGMLDASHSGCAMTLAAAKRVKDAVSIPVGTVTYMDPAHAPDLFEDAIAQGAVDFLLMNRPLNVDHDYVNKLREGRIDEIAPCTRCMHCHHDVDREGNGYTHCRVNACTRRAYSDEMPEGFDLVPAEQAKKVVVVGGGPAGMEAARIAAQRGHGVELYEKTERLGGLLDFANAVKGPHENLLSLRSYLERQLELAGVEVHAGQEVDAAFVAGLEPDVVVVATGGVRDSLGVEGTDATPVVPIDDVLAAAPSLGKRVTVVGGNAQAVDVVLMLLEQGHQVDIVMPGTIGTLDSGQSNWVKTFVLPAMYAQGVRVWPSASELQVGDGEVSFATEGGVSMTLPCDAVVEALDMLPGAGAFGEVAGAEVVAVGDCVDPWNIEWAITSGNLAARRV